LDDTLEAARKKIRDRLIQEMMQQSTALGHMTESAPLPEPPDIRETLRALFDRYDPARLLTRIWLVDRPDLYTRLIRTLQQAGTPTLASVPGLHARLGGIDVMEWHRALATPDEQARAKPWCSYPGAWLEFADEHAEPLLLDTTVDGLMKLSAALPNCERCGGPRPNYVQITSDKLSHWWHDRFAGAACAAWAAISIANVNPAPLTDEQFRARFGGLRLPSRDLALATVAMARLEVSHWAVAAVEYPDDGQFGLMLWTDIQHPPPGSQHMTVLDDSVMPWNLFPPAISLLPQTCFRCARIGMMLRIPNPADGGGGWACGRTPEACNQVGIERLGVRRGD
jgi:hypothetical protein